MDRDGPNQSHLHSQYMSNKMLLSDLVFIYYVVSDGMIGAKTAIRFSLSNNNKLS